MFAEVDYKIESELQAEKMSRPMREFETGKIYDVDGKPGQFVRSFRDGEGRPKYVFAVDGVEKTFDFDFIYLVQ